MSARNVLTAAQRRLLRNLGGWTIADALIDVEHGCAQLRASAWAGTYDHEGSRAFFDCDKRGIVVYDYTLDAAAPAAGYPSIDAYELARGRRELLRVSWSELRRYAAALPTPARGQLRSARTDLHTAWLALCGPTPAPGQRAAERDPDQCAAHWHAHRRARQRLTEALAAALPLDEVPTQLDLFEIPAG